MRISLIPAVILSAQMMPAAGFATADFARMRSVADVRLSPDGKRVAYTVVNNDGDRRPYNQLWVMTLADGKSINFSSGKDSSDEPEWSPDGTKLAYSGKLGDQSGLIAAGADGTGKRFLSAMAGTNNALPSMGKRITWSPGGNQIAFIHAVPGPETALATGDPIVITRYLYKPDADEGFTRFNDNKRLHIFLADLATGAVTQLTSGNHYEHSVQWSPKGDEIAFVSNREENEDQFFNYDLFTLKLADRSMRRLTATENIEYRPVWSPDGNRFVYQGCRRGLTDLETTMEDTHLWTILADGSGRGELTGSIDNRQGPPVWSPEGDFVYFTVQERGNVRLYRMTVAGGKPETVIAERGAVGALSAGKGGTIAYVFSSPTDPPSLYLKTGAAPARRLTNLNDDLFRGKEIAPVEAFRFISNDNKWDVEAFLTAPLGRTAGSKHPLIVVIHGGPHGQQGPAFNFKNQVYAARGWATLMVNYRGSTGYGQAFTDGVFGDQNGNEAQDVLYGLSAAMRRNLWIDRDRLGVEGVSYGGQLSAWLITQTRVFKSSIPTAPVINLVSYNYTTYYNQYEQMTFGIFPHQGNLMDVLWERSALKHVAKVATPTMLVHGENDNDVPVSESEQFYVALRDVGVEAQFVQYRREGHGLKEPKHIMDWTNRSMQWHESHFPVR
ncbi:MAG: S9 family peptidase [Acidobacteriia bacterium]|nr:S9 family peptidase [Terriglobia bacterium]